MAARSHVFVEEFFDRMEMDNSEIVIADMEPIVFKVFFVIGFCDILHKNCKFVHLGFCLLSWLRQIVVLFLLTKFEYLVVN